MNAMDDCGRPPYSLPATSDGPYGPHEARRMSTPMQYLDKAMVRLKNLGLMPDKTEEAPVVALLRRVSDLDQDKVVAIARTLSQASLFNQVVREQVASMQISDRYTIITNAFNSIRDDAKSMVEQLEDGKVNTWERLQNVWMKATRGDIPQRFDKIKKTYLEVAKDTNDQIEREHLILSAYQDFRGAVKESEVLALAGHEDGASGTRGRAGQAESRRWTPSTKRRPTT